LNEVAFVRVINELAVLIIPENGPSFTFKTLFLLNKRHFLRRLAEGLWCTGAG